MVKIIIIFTLKVRIDKNKSISGHTFLCRVSVFTEYGIETGFSLSQNKHVVKFSFTFIFGSNISISLG